MKARIIKIGNSRGVRIPKVLIDQVGFGTEVELEAEKDRLVIRPTTRPRSGWDDRFRSMAKNKSETARTDKIPKPR